MRILGILAAALVAVAGCTSDNPGRLHPGTTAGSTTGGGTTGGTTSGHGTGCSGLQCFQMACSGNLTTTVSGRVTAPNGLDPVNAATVYVPSNIPEFPPTVQCEACNDPLGGSPIVTVTTAVDGTFSLQNVPVTMQVPVIVQKGRFRKINYLNINGCTDNPLTPDQARLPRNQKEGNLPKMAVAVGDYDQIECVLRSIGIDQSEFTPPSGAGAVHLYDNTSLGSGLGGATEFQGLLTDSAKMAGYNIMFLNCTGATFDGVMAKSTVSGNLYNYVNTGGRLYVTDWSYDYMEQVMQFAPFIYYDGGGSMTTPQPIHQAATASDTTNFTATVSDSTLSAWLSAAKASSNGMITVQDLLPSWVLIKSTANSTMYPSTTWIHGNTNGADRPLTVTFDYNMCGKVLYSSYHTRDNDQPPGPLGGGAFPMYCKSTAQSMIAQEKVLEYLIFEISSCVGPVS